jgi:uncharacterized cupredoxin-like copper-binding protein
MGVRKVLFAAALISALAAVFSGVASAAHHRTAANVTVIKAVAPTPEFQINRYVQTTLRWNADSYTVKSGGTLHIVNMAADEGPHTFTVVAQKDLPKTLPQLFGCKICLKLAKAHGANPNSDAPPKFQYLENGVGTHTAPKVNQPGDSGVTGKGKKGESINLTVTAPAGTKLYFMCLIHPWMQAVVNVT